MASRASFTHSFPSACVIRTLCVCVAVHGLPRKPLRWTCILLMTKARPNRLYSNRFKRILLPPPPPNAQFTWIERYQRGEWLMNSELFRWIPNIRHSIRGIFRISSQSNWNCDKCWAVAGICFDQIFLARLNLDFLYGFCVFFFNVLFHNIYSDRWWAANDTDENDVLLLSMNPSFQCM